MDEQVEKIMTLLECTEEQAKQVIADDKAVDKMTKMSEINADLTPEQIAVSKKYRQGARKPVAYKFEKRERKADDVKRELISLLGNALAVGGATSVENTNPERQIDFEFEGRRFRVVLSAPRK